MTDDIQRLKKTVEDVSNIIFGDSPWIVSIFTKDESNEFLKVLSDYSFLCEIELKEGKINQEQIDRLSKFISKEVKYLNSNLNKIYWLEGDGKTYIQKGDNKLPNRQTKYIPLPTFLDDYIFNKLGAKYAPDHTRFSKNLSHNREEVLIYLGTYFPRSFGETYSIFNNILHNGINESAIRNKKEINILDIGSGTGGNLSGLLLSLIECTEHDLNLNIIAIDGNNEALIVLEKIISEFRFEFKLNISLVCHYVMFNNVTDLYHKSAEYINHNFDFILSSKMINEIIHNDQDSYFNFYHYFADLLTDDGFMLMLDVTTKVDGINYLPVILNRQTNNYIRQHNEQYKTLIPTICSDFESICSKDCFCNNVFYITHSRKRGDKSKVSYRIIGKRQHVLQILTLLSEKGGIIGWDSSNRPKYCMHIPANDAIKSAYFI